MKKIKIFINGILISLILLLASVAQSTIINAESCSQTHVQAAITSANTGDTVIIPTGTSTWTSAVIIPDTKKITLQGAGSNSTIITVNITSGEALKAGFSKSRITGICFYLPNATTAINIRGTEWRIDHCKFDNPGTSGLCTGVFANGTSPYPKNILNGLVDNCEFINSRVLVCGDLALLAHEIWAQPLGLGTASAVYVEDCIITFTVFGNAIDANYGGSYVFRYNTVNDTSIDCHSLQSNSRGTRKWEIYNNTINQMKRTMWVPMFIRGGTGVIFNNVITGTWSTPKIAIDNVRSCQSRDVCGICDGSSPWDGNESGQKGYPCRDQIGRSTDQWLWTASKPYPPQALDPVYAWNNKHGVNDVTFYLHNCSQNAFHIQEGRDYYINVIKPGYTPYTYPHPLRGSDRGKPAPPAELKISN